MRESRGDGSASKIARRSNGFRNTSVAWVPSFSNDNSFARLRIVGWTRARAGGDTASRPDILSVPTRSLLRRGALTGVYVVRAGRAHLRWLRLGATDGERVAVLGGLDRRDEIAVDPTGLSDGRAVRVVP